MCIVQSEVCIVQYALCTVHLYSAMGNGQWAMCIMQYYNVRDMQRAIYMEHCAFCIYAICILQCLRGIYMGSSWSVNILDIYRVIIKDCRL